MRCQKKVTCLAVFMFVLLIGGENVARVAAANAASPQSQELKELIGVIHQFYLGEVKDRGQPSRTIRTLRGSQPGVIAFFEDGSVSDYRFSGKRRRFVIRQAIKALNPSLAVQVAR